MSHIDTKNVFEVIADQGDMSLNVPGFMSTSSIAPITPQTIPASSRSLEVIDHGYRQQGVPVRNLHGDAVSRVGEVTN